jgi:hypothetical protein
LKENIPRHGILSGQVSTRYRQPPAFSSYTDRITDNTFFHNPSICTFDTYAKFIKSICELTLKSIGEKSFMVSFEFSLVDIVLMIAIIVLLALYLTKSSTEPRAELERPVKEEKTLEKPTVPVETQKSPEEALLTTSVETEDSAKCTHQFGYLKKLPKDASIPDECFTCPKYIRCALEDR